MAALQNDFNTSSLQDASIAEPSKAVQNQTIEAVKDIVYGSTAGVLGKFIEYPFDTVKVRLQSQATTPGQPKLAGPLDAFRAAFRSSEGPLLSLYRGISAPLLGAAIETSSLFFSYRVAQDLVIASSPRLSEQKRTQEKVELPLEYLIGCGAASGAFTSLALTPIELIKCKMQVPLHTTSATGPSPASIRSAGPLQILGNVLKSQGVLGLWHGQLGTLIRETGGSAAWFGSYEGVKMLYLKFDKSLKKIDDVKVWQQLTAGAVAGMSYNFVFYPADTIKSRMQTEEVGVGRPKATFLVTGKELWRDAGLKGFYRGCGITVFRAAPSSAIIFSIYEAFRKYLG